MSNKVKVLLLMFLVTLTLCNGTYAESQSSRIQSTDHAPMIQPRYSYTNSITTSLSFTNGKAVCNGVILPMGNYSASVTAALYKKSGGVWKYVTSWSGSATNGRSASAGGSVAVSRGTYKLIVTGDVGGGLESPRATREKTY